MKILLNKSPCLRVESASKASNVRISKESGRNQREILLTSIWLKEEDLKQSHLNNLKRHCWKMTEFSLPMCWPCWCLVTILYIFTSFLYIINFKYLSISVKPIRFLSLCSILNKSFCTYEIYYTYDNSGLRLVCCLFI